MTIAMYKFTHTHKNIKFVNLIITPHPKKGRDP